MGLFKRIKELDNQNTSLALALDELKKEHEELKERLPGYEAAVARGVDDVWTKTCDDIVNFNPYKIKNNDGGEL